MNFGERIFNFCFSGEERIKETSPQPLFWMVEREGVAVATNKEQQASDACEIVSRQGAKH